MFTDIIRKTPFTDRIAEAACARIGSACAYNEDVTLLATSRALLMPRVPEDESLIVDMRNKTYNPDDIRRVNVDTAIDAMLDGEANNKLMIIQFTRATREENQFLVDYLIEHIEEKRNVKRIEKVTQFFEKMFKCACFVDVERKLSYVFVEKLNIRTFHYLQSGILAYLPWYFKKEMGISREEMDLIESLRLNKPDRYLECLAKLASNYDFRAEFTKSALRGLETRIERQEIERIKDNISDLDRIYHEYENKIGEILKDIRHKSIRMMGLEAKVRSDEENGSESEVMQYFLRNNRLYLEDANDGQFTFSVKDYLMFWDEEVAQNMIDNVRSYAYNPGRTTDVEYTQEEMKALLEEIFIHRNFKLKVCGSYSFNLQGQSVSAIAHGEYGFEFNDSTPNPHLDAYRCLGDYQRAINRFLMNNDYIGAIEQCVSSCRSLNFADGPVMQEFFKRWYGVSDYTYRINMRCIELPNGEVVEPACAIKYMKEQLAAEQEGEGNGEDRTDD